MRLSLIGRAAALVGARCCSWHSPGARCSGEAERRPGQWPRVRPKEVPAETIPSVKFVDITKEAGITFLHNNGALGEKLLPETMGSGVAFLDYDRDGDQDLFFVNSSYWPGHEVTAGPDPGALPQRRQGALRGRHQGSRARQDVLRPGRGRGRLSTTTATRTST